MNYSIGTIRRVLHDALDVWAKNSVLTFTEVGGNNADILVSFVRRDHGDENPFEGPGGVLGHAFYPGEGRGGDVHFDDEETWLIDSNSNHGSNLMGAAVHEFGHSLGLGHSSVQNSIMFPWYQGYDPSEGLPEDDVLGIQQIYGDTNTKKWAKNPYPNPPRPTRTTTTTTTTTPAPRTHPTRVFYPQQGGNSNDRRTHTHTNHHHHHHNRNPYPHPPSNRPPPRRLPPKEEGGSRRRTNTDTRRVFTERPTYTNSIDVDEQPTRKPYRPLRPDSDPNQKPDQCDMSYDAISMIRGQLFIFKNKYLWRFGENGRLMAGYPSEIRAHWRALPEDLTHIDTVYENKEMQIVFFIGQKLYVFNSDRLEPGYPRPLADLGLPRAVQKLDAVLVWGHNNRTYFYSGRDFWRFDEDTKRVELDYPRDMTMWAGVSNDIDSAFQYKDHRTYFLKGKGFWKFNDHKMRVEKELPQSNAIHWMKCPKAQNDDEDHETFGRRNPGRRGKIVASSGSRITTGVSSVVLLMIMSRVISTYLQ